MGDLILQHGDIPSVCVSQSGLCISSWSLQASAGDCWLTLTVVQAPGNQADTRGQAGRTQLLDMRAVWTDVGSIRDMNMNNVLIVARWNNAEQ